MGGGFVRTIAVPTPFPVGPTNCHVLLRDPLTLVDTGPLTEDAWDALRRGLAEVGRKVEDVERILLTHGHADHFGLARRVADVSGAQVFGGRFDHRHFKMERPARLILEKLSRAGFGIVERLAVMASVAAVDRYADPLEEWDELSGGEVLPGDGYGVRVRSSPGHTPGSLTFDVEEGGPYLFTGDTVLHRITPNAIVDEDPEKPGETFRSLGRYVETLEVLERESRGARLLTGHGRSIRDFGSHRRQMEERNARRIAALEKELALGARTVRQLVTALFPWVKTLNIYLAYSEVVGFLMYLEDLGRVERTRRPLRDLFSLVAGAPPLS